MKEPFDLVDQGDPGDHPDEMRATPGTYNGGDDDDLVDFDPGAHRHDERCGRGEWCDD